MTQTSDPNARRTYWADQMDQGYQLVQRVLEFQVRECGEGFASIPDAAEEAHVEMEFSTSKIAGELDRVFYLRQGLIAPLMAAGRAMNQRGWMLKIEDAYRSIEMQRQLVRKPEVFRAIVQKCVWECGGSVPPVELVYRRAAVLVANIPKVGTHMSCSAVDISVLCRDDGREVWRGKPYLEMSEHTPMRSPFVEQAELQARLEITEIMEQQGWVHFPFEFWHYNQGDAMGHVLRGDPTPARYGPVHWDPQTNLVTPYEDPLSLLNPLDVLQREMEALSHAGQASAL